MNVSKMQRYLGAPVAIATLVLVLGLAGARPAAAESLTYQWALKGFLGRLAGLVLPNHGKGELRSHPDDGGRVTELEITSPESKSGEFFLYGGATGANGATTEAWSAYRWNGKESNKRGKVDEPGVVDMASGIHLIRERQPESPLRLRIWSDGKVYAVVVQRAASERITVPAGNFATNHYTVRGVEMAGEHYWRGGLDLWLAQDADATPVKIRVDRGFAHVELQLLPGTGGSGRPARR